MLACHLGNIEVLSMQRILRNTTNSNFFLIQFRYFTFLALNNRSTVFWHLIRLKGKKIGLFKLGLETLVKVN